MFSTDGRRCAVWPILQVLSLVGLTAPAWALDYPVTTSAAAGAGSLHEAIGQANANPGADTISFQIGGGGHQVITVGAGGLPEISEQLTIDGETQTGFSGTPLIEIQGDAAGTTSGLVVSADNCVIQGLCINGFELAGIDILADSCTATGNYLGTEADGVTTHSNLYGLRIDGGDQNQIGGTSSGEGNLISGNSGAGLYLLDDARLNTIQGNRIGTDVTGDVTLANGGAGILVEASPENQIGGTSAGAGNTVGGNLLSGIHLKSGSSTTTIQGNFIGTNAGSSKVLGNVLQGLEITESDGIVIGGASAGARNLISGNTRGGIYTTASQALVIQGNYIGCDSSGTTEVPNRVNGIYMQWNSQALIGGTAAGEGNLIAGNRCTEFQGGNLVMTNSSATIQGNLIGCDVTGQVSLFNDLCHGIQAVSCNNLVIGGDTAGARNLISGNQLDGINLSNCVGSTIQNNYVGVDITGAAALSNRKQGITSSGGNTLQIGGDTALARNLVSGNFNGSGISISATSNVTIQNNYVGVDVGGTYAIKNFNSGVTINGGSNILIGGLTLNTGNLLSGNGRHGLEVGAAASNVQIYQNRIGVDESGTASVPNGAVGEGASGFGVEVGGLATVKLGDSATGIGNLISGNLRGGIRLSGSARNCVVVANKVGTDASGIVAVPNGGDGIVIEDGYKPFGPFSWGPHTIGGLTGNEANLICGNSGNGVSISNSTTMTVVGNYIGVRQDGATALANGGDGIALSNGTQGTVVGGTSAAARNLISGNGGAGVSITDSSLNQVLGNHIGVQENGIQATPNGGDGVEISGGSLNVIGSAAGGQNIIAANPGHGVSITDSTTNTVQANAIGTDATGILATLGNGLDGVAISGGGGNLVGGAGATLRNVISANVGAGVTITNSVGNTLAGNRIGMNGTGTAALPNLGAGGGVTVSGGSGNSIGTAAADGGNLISGHTAGRGVTLLNTAGNSVENNVVGLEVTGTTPAYNVGEAVFISGGSGNVIGGSAADSGNVLAVNTGNDAIVISGSASNTVAGNLVNLNAAGTSKFGAANGIRVTGGSGNVIGGTTALERNVIAADMVAVLLDGSTANNTVLGNYLGTEITGTTSLGMLTGIWVTDGASGNVIGGSAAGAGNLISGMDNLGVLIDSGSGNTVAGNLIGTDLSGTAAFPNKLGGVLLEGTTSGNTIGGTSAGARNIISGNGGSEVGSGDGIVVDDSATGNFIQGNYIGLDITGTVALPNRYWGIRIGGNGNTIGGDAPGAGNVVAGNGIPADPQPQIFIWGASNTVVQGNLVGTDRFGNVGIACLADGIQVDNGPGTVIGGTTAGAGNVIAAASGRGLSLRYAPGAVIAGNKIGTNLSGTVALANGQQGIYVDGTGSLAGATIGPNNVISGNAAEGIWISGSSAVGYTILGNRIGTNAAGTGALANHAEGIRLDSGTTSNTIGGSAAGEGNVVSGNTGAGIYIADSPAPGNVVVGNLVGTNLAGTLAIPNAMNGIQVVRCEETRIGGNGTGEGNLVSGNLGSGILVEGDTTTGTLIAGNRIGSDASGTALVANVGAGVRVTSATATQVGGVLPGQGNRIIGGPDGVVAVGTTTTLVLADSISSHTALGIDLGADGPTPNDPGDADGLQNFPTITGFESGPTETTITATLASLPDTPFRVEFFRNDMIGALGYGEGLAFLGAAEVTTNGSGAANITFVAPEHVAWGQLLTATATNLAGGGTSEFSPPMFVPVTLSGFGLE